MVKRLDSTLDLSFHTQKWQQQLLCQQDKTEHGFLWCMAIIKSYHIFSLRLSDPLTCLATGVAEQWKMTLPKLIQYFSAITNSA